VRKQQVDPQQVIARYRELHHLQRTGDEFGITRERVRQIVNRAGISTARAPKPKPQQQARFCPECGAPVTSGRLLFCETHRTARHRVRRWRQRVKADPERYAQWRERNKHFCRRYGAREREQAST